MGDVQLQPLQDFEESRRQLRALQRDGNSTTAMGPYSKVPGGHRRYEELPSWEALWGDLYRPHY